MGQTIKEFQQDLKNGMTIEDALNKHDLSFKEALSMCPKSNTSKKRQKIDALKNRGRYIQQQRNWFRVRKNIGGKTVDFGGYKSLEDAIQIRDYLIENGWNVVKRNQACKELGISLPGVKK